MAAREPLAPRNAEQVLDAEFLIMRSKMLDLAAAFDRLGRASGTVADDPRLQRLRQALEILGNSRIQDKAEAVQQAFSLEYHADWQQRFQL